MMTYHFKPLDERAEVGVFLVVGNEGGLHSFPSTFNVDTRPIHLGQVHPLQVPQTPEQNLQDEPDGGFSFAFVSLINLVR